MNKIPLGVLNSKITLVSDDNYHLHVKKLCQQARRRIFANLFIIDLFPSVKTGNEENNDNIIIELLVDIEDAIHRGVDVRLLIGGSKSNVDIQDKTEATLKHCKRKNIPAHLLSLTSKKTSHKKLLIVDDCVLTGSHNWSHGAFTDQVQDSLLLEDNRLASYFAESIAVDWRNIVEEMQNV